MIEIFTDCANGSIKLTIDGKSSGFLVENDSLLKSGAEFFITFFVYGCMSCKTLRFTGL